METIIRKIKTCENEVITMTFVVCKGNQEFYENIENFLFSQPKDKEIMTGRDSKGYQTFEIRTNNDIKEDKEFYVNYLVDSNKIKRTSYTESGYRWQGFRIICKSMKTVDKVFNDYLESYKRLEGEEVQEVVEVPEAKNEVVETKNEVVETKNEVVETETQVIETVEVPEAQNNVVDMYATLEQLEDSDMTQDRVAQDTDQLHFPTIQAFLEATDNIEETDSGDLVFTIRGTKYLNTHKEVCKKYSANSMFVGNYVFVDGINTAVDIVVGEETYPMVEIEYYERAHLVPCDDEDVDIDLEQSFDKYQEGLQEIIDFFGINRTTLHEIYWCEEIKKVALPYNRGTQYKYKNKDVFEGIGLSEDCIVFKKGDYTAVLYSDYDEPVSLYITKNFLD